MTTPTIRSLILPPALITLAVTLLRLASELGGAPAWLASNEAGGPGALLGITWLPLFFGPWFALKLRPHFQGAALRRQLLRTLLAYGQAARIPVVILTLFALFGEWGTHYEKFPFEVGMAGKIGVTFFAQLVFWAGAWTCGVGGLAAWLTLKLRPQAQASRPTAVS